MPPLVSVLIPVYNGEKFLEATLEAVLKQNLDDIEVIVTDNASTDETPRIIEAAAAKDERVHAIRHPRNLGPFLNLRAGLELSSGSFVKWQAADDYLDQGFLMESVGILEDSPDVALVVGAMAPVSEDGQRLEFDGDANGYWTDYGEFVPRHLFPDDSTSEQPSNRFRSVLEGVRGNLIAEFLYGMHRGSVLRGASPFGVYLGAEKVLIAEVLLRGRAVPSKVPSSERVFHTEHFGARSFEDTVKSLNPDFKGRFSLPAARQAAGYAHAIRTADISSSERRKCFGILARKTTRRQSLERLLKPGPQNYFGWRR